MEKKKEVHRMEEGDDGEEERIEHEPHAEAFLRPQYKVLKSSVHFDILTLSWLVHGSNFNFRCVL